MTPGYSTIGKILAVGSDVRGLALSALRDGGRYVLAGLDPQQHVSLNAYPDLHRRDLEIVSALQPATETDFAERFRFSLQLADQGRLQLENLSGEASGWRLVAGDTARQ